MPHIKHLLLTALLCLLPLAGCYRTYVNPDIHAPRSGHLLICGGGMKDDNAGVYGRFVQLAGEGASIGVVPTATGVENPGASTTQLLKSYALPSQTVILLPLTKDDAKNADDPAIADQVRACRGLWFVGGDQSRITAVFRPRTAERPADSLTYAATLDVLRAGGVIAGTSAGAAVMCDPMITGGTSEDALKNGATWTNDVTEGQGVGLARGMGYFRHGLTDQHFLQRGRLGRLLVAMNAAKVRNAWAISENGCLEVNLKTGSMRAIGPYSVIHVTLGTHTPPDPSLIPDSSLMKAGEWEKVQLGD